KVEELDTVADDYVTKPFGMRELLARVRAALRRSPETDAERTIIEDGDFRIDLETRHVEVGGRDVRLSPKEFGLLVYFIRISGKVTRPRTLLYHFWSTDYPTQ